MIQFPDNKTSALTKQSNISGFLDHILGARCLFVILSSDPEGWWQIPGLVRISVRRAAFAQDATPLLLLIHKQQQQQPRQLPEATVSGYLEWIIRYSVPGLLSASEWSVSMEACDGDQHTQGFLGTQEDDVSVVMYNVLEFCPRTWLCF